MTLTVIAVGVVVGYFALVSSGIAVSLRRIADVLEKESKHGTK